MLLYILCIFIVVHCSLCTMHCLLLLLYIVHCCSFLRSSTITAIRTARVWRAVPLRYIVAITLVICLVRHTHASACVVDAGRLMSGRELDVRPRVRALDGGPVALDAGPRTLDAGPRTPDAGSRTLAPPSPRSMQDIAARWLMAAPLLLRPTLCPSCTLRWCGNDFFEPKGMLFAALLCLKQTRGTSRDDRRRAELAWNGARVQQRLPPQGWESTNHCRQYFTLLKIHCKIGNKHCISWRWHWNNTVYQKKVLLIMSVYLTTL